MRVKLTVTKETAFQGNIDEFSNVYTYEDVAADDASLNALADAVVAAEKTVFAQDVNFRRVRIWNIGGLGPSTMQLTKDLTGSGAVQPSTGMYRECAIMVRFKLAPRVALFPTTNNPARRISPYLRKFLHTGALHGYDAPGNGPGTVPVAGSTLPQYAATIREPRPGIFLCNDAGEKPADAATFSRYLEHRQFPRGRKES